MSKKDSAMLMYIKNVLEKGNYTKEEPNYDSATLRHIATFNFVPFNSHIHVAHATELTCQAGTLYAAGEPASFIIFDSTTFADSIPSVVGVLAHEVWHAIHFLLEEKYEIKPDDNSDELYGHYMESVVRNIYEKLQPYLKKVKKK